MRKTTGKEEIVGPYLEELRELFMDARNKDPSRNHKASLSRYVSVRKVPPSKVKEGKTYYVELKLRGKVKKVFCNSKRSATSIADYVKHFIVSKKPSDVISGRKKAEKRQFYYNCKFVDALDNFYMYILENDGLPSVGGRTAGQVLSAVSAVRRVLGENQMTLLQFYHPVSFLENLRLLLKGFIETGSTKASLLKVFLRNNHHFKRYLVENAKAEIRRKFKNQESEIEEELLFLKTNPLINDGIKEEYLSFVKNELPKSKKRPLQDYSDPRIFIKQLRDGLDRLATLQDLQTAFAILLNEGLNLRQNEFCALTFNDFDFDSGRYKVRDFNRAVVKAVRGETLVPRNKTNSPIFKNLDPFFNFIIDDLREVAFSSEAFSKFSLSVKKSDDGEKVVILENKTQFQSTFELEGRSLLGFLREEGYSFFRRRLKGVEKVFLLEGGLKTNDVGGVVRYIGSGAFRSAHKSVLGRLGIEYKAPHRRFRADPVTHMLKNGGVTVENTQKIQRAMNWKDHQMVHQYTNNTLDKDEETSLLGDLDEPIKQEPAGLDIDSLSAEERDKLLKKLLARI